MHCYPTSPKEFPTVADCLHYFESEGPSLNPDHFRPLIGLTGRVSAMKVGGKPYSLMMAANAWINHFHEAGVSVENAIEAIALNGEQYPGLVALALEVALVCQKSSAPPELIITLEQYMGLIDRIYVANIGGIYTFMHKLWDATLRPDTVPVQPRKTRSQWREELTHDVLIHPANLLPIRNRLGYLHYISTSVCSFRGAEMTFRPPRGDLLVIKGFPNQYQYAD